MISSVMRRAGQLVLLTLLFVFQIHLQAQFSGAPSSGGASSIPQAQLMQPEELNTLLGAQGAQKPLVLQVGSRVLFAQAHIPGAEYAGPGSQPAGLQLLQDKVAQLPHKTLLVLYCGCCPWSRCPNVGPAYKLLRDLGFSNVKVLYIADNFGTNWVDKGFSVEQNR
jgi:hypothetical protein